ncbi:MAG: hypothetical protein DRI98_11345 [Bacteroidetes bacterium]|nr:MAG: hypothetical protein DRI98_11345 [Bacteroidota bacterium]
MFKLDKILAVKNAFSFLVEYEKKVKKYQKEEIKSLKLAQLKMFVALFRGALKEDNWIEYLTDNMFTYTIDPTALVQEQYVGKLEGISGFMVKITEIDKEVGKRAKKAIREEELEDTSILESLDTKDLPQA